MADYDVVVVGAGNAALSAAVSARNCGAQRVLVIEKASEQMRGGNTHYSGGLLRIAFDRADDILRLVPKARELEGFVEGIEAYPAESFWADLRRMTSDRSDPELAQILISNSFDTACWMADQGIRFEPAITLGAVKVGGVIKWPKGAIVRAAHEPGGDTDKFGRQLWDVWLPDGRFLESVLAAAGAARAYPYPPQTEYADLIGQLAAQAAASRRGLWGPPCSGHSFG